MSNINDYILWRGDIEISDKFKFNEVDSMIFARFSYLPFEHITLNESETIESISKKMQKLPDDKFRYNGDKELIINLGNSIRFKDLIVTDYANNNNKEEEKQFCAITIHLPYNEIYVSYIGTDNTIYGWKEDFNMSFMDNVPCQIEGKEYLKEISKKYKKENIRVGGHSKGGNVAIYSSITVPKRIQDRIIQIYNYDGPGFSKKIIAKYGNDEIIDKIETYIPEDSIIGRILNHKEKIRIVKSTEKGIYEHDIYSWQVLKDKVIEVKENSATSENIDKTLTSWLETTTAKQRKIFIDTVFEIFYSTDANTFKDISKNLTSNILIMLKKYSSLSQEDKKTITDMIKIFSSLYLNTIKEAEIEKIGIKKEEYLNIGKEKIKEIDKYIKNLKNKRETT